MRLVTITLLVAFIACAVAWAVGYFDVSGPPLQAGSATWKDAPGSNQYGPLTGAVWMDRSERLEQSGLYHRLKCPRLSQDRVPLARYALTAEQPCDLCQPNGNP